MTPDQLKSCTYPIMGTPFAMSLVIFLLIFSTNSKALFSKKFVFSNKFAVDYETPSQEIQHESKSYVRSEKQYNLKSLLGNKPSENISSKAKTTPVPPAQGQKPKPLPWWKRCLLNRVRKNLRLA